MAKRETFELPATGLASAFRHIAGGWRSYILYVEQAATNGDVKMGRVLSTWLNIPPDEQNTISPERLCDIAQVKPEDLFGSVCRELYAASARESMMILGARQAEVVHMMADQATKVKGGKDRERFLRSTGVLPTPKPSAITVNAFAVTGQGAAAAATDKQANIRLPRPEDRIRQWERAHDSTGKLKEGLTLDVPPGDSRPVD